MFRNLACVFAVALSSVSCAPAPLVDQDVSFLVPLDQARSFLPASGATAEPLMSRAFIDWLPPLTVVDEPDALYAALSTVSVRLDACFIEGPPNQVCRPQVRLVLQPVFDSADGTTTRDAAVHLFFSVTEAQVKRVVSQLALLRTRLGIAVPAGLNDAHPGFARDEWVQGARALLQPLLRSDKLVRVTAMNVHASGEAWIFSGLDISGSTRTTLEVPTFPSEIEAHVTSTGGTGALELTLVPPPRAEKGLQMLLQTTTRQQAPAGDVAAAVQGLLRIEDPAAHNPGTLDCASCHVVATVKSFLAREAPGLVIDSPAPSSDAYADSRNMRAFGYFFQKPAISPRAQREASAGRADLSHRLEQ